MRLLHIHKNFSHTYNRQTCIKNRVVARRRFYTCRLMVDIYYDRRISLLKLFFWWFFQIEIQFSFVVVFFFFSTLSLFLVLSHSFYSFTRKLTRTQKQMGKRTGVYFSLSLSLALWFIFLCVFTVRCASIIENRDRD